MRRPTTGPLRFEWDERHARRSLRERRPVSFEEAVTAFGDPLSLTVPDPDDYLDAVRWVLIGRSSAVRHVIALFREHGDRIRLFGTRLAFPREISNIDEA